MKDKEEILQLHMAQSHIMTNMPHGGYGIVSKRLKNRNILLSSVQIIKEIRSLKKANVNIEVLAECCTFLKENNIELTKPCINLLNSFKQKKER